jgi:hypothetical protein
MCPDEFFDRPQLAVAKPVILRQLDDGLKPILGLPVRAVHMDVQPWFFSGKEEEPEAVLPEDRRTHGQIRDSFPTHACAIIPIPLETHNGDKR